MRYVYLPRPVRVDAIQWTNAGEPPPGVHDVWLNPDTHRPVGYVSTPDGEKLATVGDFIVTSMATAELGVIDADTFLSRFTKDE